jgi:hypothetical protein
MSKLWLKFGCFLIGYKYKLLENCTTGSEKAVIKYTSAVLLVCLIWGFIGYSFTHHYLHGGVIESIFSVIVMVFVVIQIERQIILTIGKNNRVLWLRGFLAVSMAFIGSIIIDQIIFSEDVAREQVSKIEDKVNEILPKKIVKLNGQIDERDSIIKIKEDEILKVEERVRKQQFVSVPTSVIKYVKDTITGVLKQNGIITTWNSTQNPEVEFIPQIQAQIDTLRKQKSKLESKFLTIRESTKDDLEKHPSFFDELNILFTIIFNSKITALLYIALWLALFIIELLVLFSKLSDSKNDYEKIVEHQMNIRNKQLEALNGDL